MINFPTSLDTLTNPISNNTLDSPSHSGQHSYGNDAVEALEAKVGANSSAVTSSLDYLVKSTSSSNPGHKHTLANGATDLTKASAAEINTGTDDAKFATALALAGSNIPNSRLNSKIISGTKNMAAGNGNVSYTGVGFRPTSIIAMSIINGSATITILLGFADSTKTSNGIGLNTVSWYLQDTLVGGWSSQTDSDKATVASFDADGFTLTWTATGSPTGTLSMCFLCFR